MKHLATFLTIVFLTINSQSVLAQDKTEKKAENKVEKMHQKLIDAGYKTGLTELQKADLKKLYLLELNEIDAIQETDEAIVNEKTKEIHQKYGKLVHTDILNKEQKSALKDYNANKKE
jgi:hypothetical protein